MPQAPAGNTPPGALVQRGAAPARPAHLLLVEDEPHARDVLLSELTAAGHRLSTARSLREARHRLAEAAFDLVILDVGLPDGSGLDLCAEVRRTSEVPVLIVSAAGTPEERIAGFDAGADDYLPKPLHPVELARRVTALLRRANYQATDSLITGAYGLTLDVRLGLARYDGQEAALTRSETGLLRLLIERAGTAVPAEELSRRVWNYESLGESNFLHQHISRLRRKLRATGYPTDAIHTVYGVGYSMRAAPRHIPSA